jgi:uncharacterized membrane protein
MMGRIRRYLLSGLLVWVPIWVTVLVIQFFVHLLDSIMNLLPQQYRPDYLVGFHIPGLGVVIIVLVIFITGIVAANFLGKRVVNIWDALINRIPIVRSIYNAVKQIMNTLISSDGHSFRKVLLVEYPRKGLWSIAFQTGKGCEEIKAELGGDELVTLFIPTTPNPTSGFLMMAKRSEVIEMDMPVKQALKFVISLGVVQPGTAVEEDKLLDQKG